MILWIAIGTLTLLAVLPSLWPLLRPGKPTGTRLEHDLEVFSDQLREVDLELSADELTAETTDEDQKSFSCNRAKGSKCAQSCAEKPWWKFWEKKSTKNCPCRKAEVTETILQNKR